MKNSIDLNENQMDRFAEAAVKHNIEKQLKEKYGKILKEQEKANEKAGKVINIYSIMKVAAVVVTVLGSIFLIQESYFSPSTQIMAQNLLDQTMISGNPDITRKGNSQTNDDKEFSAILLQREANDAFIKKDYSTAVSKYQKLESANQFLSIDKFYLSISHLKIGNYTEAITHFQEIKTTEKIQLEEVDWLLSLAYIIDGQKEEARPILEQIVSQNQYKAEEAKKLLNKI